MSIETAFQISLFILCLYICCSFIVHSSIAVIKIRELQDYYDYVEYKTLNSIIESAAEGEISAEEIDSIRSNLSRQYIALQTELYTTKFIKIPEKTYLL